MVFLNTPAATRTRGQEVVVADEEIVVEIADQRFCGDSPWVPTSGHQHGGRVLRRQFACGRDAANAARN